MNNEQRAHDLTILYVKFMTDINLKSTIANCKNTSSDTIECNVDFYNEYCKLYPQILEKVNRDFPIK